MESYRGACGMRFEANLAVGRLIVETAYERYNEAHTSTLRPPYFTSLFTLVDSISHAYLQQDIFISGRADFSLMVKMIAWRAMARGFDAERDVTDKWTYSLYELDRVLTSNGLRPIVRELDGEVLAARLKVLYAEVEPDPTKLGAFGQFAYDLLLDRCAGGINGFTGGKRRRTRVALHHAALACEHSTTTASRRSNITDALAIFQAQFPSSVRSQLDGMIKDLLGILEHSDDPSLWRYIDR